MQRCWGERIVAVVFILVATFFAYTALEYPAGGGTFPLFATIGTIALSIAMIVNSFIDKNPAMREKIKFDWRYERIKPMVIFGVALLHIWSIFLIGYFTSAILFFGLAVFLVGVRQNKTVLITAIVLFPAMYAFFVLFLKAQLPRGILF